MTLHTLVPRSLKRHQGPTGRYRYTQIHTPSGAAFGRNYTWPRDNLLTGLSAPKVVKLQTPCVAESTTTTG